MDTTQDIRPPAFVGWHRRRREAWRAVCSADNESSCWRLLLDILPRGGERIVLPAGRAPADRPAAGEVRQS